MLIITFSIFESKFNKRLSKYIDWDPVNFSSLEPKVSKTAPICNELMTRLGSHLVLFQWPGLLTFSVARKSHFHQAFWKE
jgi:hypothetical protein